MKTPKFCLSSVFILSIFLLAGCGFKLKGTQGSFDSPSLVGTEVVLISGEPRGELNTALREQLRLQGTMMADLNLSQGTVALIADTDARVVRQFLDDPLNVVGKTEELELLREEMREDLAAQIIRRVTHSLNKQLNADQT